MINYYLPIHLESEPNMRAGHWGRRQRKAKMHREATLVIPKGVHALPCIVTITRVGKKPLDTDNLAASAKFLRDGIADRLGVDDADPRVTWRYEQGRGEYGAVVRIERAGSEPASPPSR